VTSQLTPADGRAVFAIVGAGLAGAKAAFTLREEGFDGRVLLVGAEPHAPYDRPPLSKDYLRGESAPGAPQVEPRAAYADKGIELMTGAEAVSLDPAAHRLGLADGRTIAYDRLLIATGAVPRRPPIPGAELDGVMTLRTLDDSDRLRRLLRRGGRLAIVGGGWIGCEVAASAQQLGCDVTLVELAARPLERVLGPQLGEFYAGVHRSHGVELLTGAQVAAIGGRGAVERLQLADGRSVACDAVVLGVGVAPATRLARAAGLAIADGVVVDERLAADAPDVFAAGDVASALHPRYGRHVRVEHWANALEQGPAAARAMLGAGTPYDRLPYFFSDQYDVGMEYAGLHGAGDRLVVRGALEPAGFQAFWLDAEGRLTAGMHVNDWDAVEPIKRLVGGGAGVDAVRLGDLSVPLDELAGEVADRV
jgi:3-phenylpropionate/trans-cinnamate dioxygenase ferredoxin reductase subunit